MKSDELFSAISDIDDKYILEATVPVAKSPWLSIKRLGALAACLVLAVAVTIGALSLRFGLKMSGDTSDKAPTAPDQDRSDAYNDEMQSTVQGGIELYERVENEYGYFQLVSIGDGEITIRLKLKDKEGFGILYLEEYGEEHLYTSYGSLGDDEDIMAIGYERADTPLEISIDGKEGEELPLGEEIEMRIKLPTLVEGNTNYGMVKIRLGDRIAVI